MSGHGSSGSDGIELNGTGVTSTNIFGNIIGLDAAGTNALSNGQDGILITAGATSSTVGAATSTPGTAGGNVISGNNRHGVRIDSTASGTLLQGNVIGLRADGATAQRNLGSGISTAAADTTVGGATASQRNVVSGGNTIVLAAGAHNAAVKGNFLGTDVNGTVKVVDGGVSASDVTTTGITGLVIGGLSSSPGAPPGNVVAGGIALTGQGVHDAVVQGNIVGLDVTGNGGPGGHGDHGLEQIEEQSDRGHDGVRPQRPVRQYERRDHPGLRGVRQPGPGELHRHRHHGNDRSGQRQRGRGPERVERDRHRGLHRHSGDSPRKPHLREQRLRGLHRRREQCGPGAREHPGGQGRRPERAPQSDRGHLPRGQRCGHHGRREQRHRPEPHLGERHLRHDHGSDLPGLHGHELPARELDRRGHHGHGTPFPTESA